MLHCSRSTLSLAFRDLLTLLFSFADSSPESTPALESSERFETPFTSPAGPLPWPVTSPHTTLRTDEGDEFSLVSPSFSSPPSSFCATPTTPALVLPEYSPRLTKKQSTPARLVRSFFASEPVPELPTRTVEAKSSSSGKSLGKRVASILATGFVDNPLHQQYCDNLDQQSSYRCAFVGSYSWRIRIEDAQASHTRCGTRLTASDAHPKRANASSIGL